MIKAPSFFCMVAAILAFQPFDVQCFKKISFLKFPNHVISICDTTRHDEAASRQHKCPSTVHFSKKAEDDPAVQYQRILARYEAYDRSENELIRSDVPLFLAFAALQAIPFFGITKQTGLLYFMGMAVVTVYLGAKRSDLILPTDEERPLITAKSALFAPLISSVSLFGIYLLLKYTSFHPETLYHYMATAFGAISASSLFGALVRSLAPDIGNTQIPLPHFLEGVLVKPDGAPEEYRPTISVSGLLGAMLGMLLAGVYLSPLPLNQTFICNNLIAWAIAMNSLGVISVQSFGVACAFLMGLFCYDVWWVYGTDVMMTVATKVEAPVKFLFPSNLAADGMPRAYPFSVLGLGDIVIPGIFCAMMRKIDGAGMIGSMPADSPEAPQQRLSYFNSSVVGYSVGLALTFYVNQVTQLGQPALLFLNPSIILSAIATATFNKELLQLLKYEFNENDLTGSLKEQD